MTIQITRNPYAMKVGNIAGWALEDDRREWLNANVAQDAFVVSIKDDSSWDVFFVHEQDGLAFAKFLEPAAE